MLIEIWSDVVCPFCYIGKRRLEAALADFEHRDEVEVVYRSFELDPSAPEVGTESIGDALARKYGGGPAETRAAMDRVAAMAAEVGLRFAYADATHTRTLEAHRLLHLALAESGPGAQRTLVEALMAAYFTQGRSMGDRTVLRDVAVGAGLPAERVDAVLTSQEYAEQVSADIEQARAYGISGVPFFVLDRRLAVSGAQPQEVFAQALRQAHEHAHAAPGASSEVG
ncbi:DsbA family oxidoreductase [Nocardioides sp. HDW12B]|uniref:DsbA family oxidoreductase n=1 Tax=Nocardioides sp. HDW12B TaxID=2714939 RepID=UPI0014094DDE|nr:DsbA family oxidoreductase [Nocardioides sp. HDW12B]QIK67040.1 DsbA family oxidoreductase [Nocardioides sp. HDW12B]